MFSFLNSRKVWSIITAIFIGTLAFLVFGSITKAEEISTIQPFWATNSQTFTKTVSDLPVDFGLSILIPSYPSSQYAFGLGFTISSSVPYTEQITLHNPENVEFPWFCSGGAVCTWNLGSSNQGGNFTSYAYGHVIITGTYTFIVDFTELNTGVSKTVTLTTYLAPYTTPSPVIGEIQPSTITPGKMITITGNYFIENGGLVTDYQIWFIDQSTGGVNLVDYHYVVNHLGWWGENQINVQVPDNLWPCRNIMVTIVRGDSHSTQYPVKSICRYYFPIVSR